MDDHSNTYWYNAVIRLKIAALSVLAKNSTTRSNDTDLNEILVDISDEPRLIEKHKAQLHKYWEDCKSNQIDNSVMQSVDLMMKRAKKLEESLRI